MISTLNKRSHDHENHCEDNLYITENDGFIYGAVFDGCSSGINTHWASQTLNYIFHNLSKKNFFINGLFDSLEIEVNNFLFQVGVDLYKSSKLLELKTENLLSTIVFFAYEKSTKLLYVKFLGDGTFFIYDDEWKFIDNNEDNMPLYLGYYCADNEQMRKYIESRASYLLENVNHFAICTDGIDSFRNYKEKISISDPVTFLIKEDKFFTMKHELGKKFNILKEDGWVIHDDLTIIKYKSI